PPPLIGIDLVDRRAILMGHATPDLAPISHDSDIAANNTVWPDTIPVLKFAHFLEQHLAPASQFSRLAPPVPTSRWWGSDQLKYAYRLTEVQLAEGPPSGAAGPGARRAGRRSRWRGRSMRAGGCRRRGRAWPRPRPTIRSRRSTKDATSRS